MTTADVEFNKSKKTLRRPDVIIKINIEKLLQSDRWLNLKSSLHTLQHVFHNIAIQYIVGI